MPQRDPENPELTVYFDGGCPLCRAEIAYLKEKTDKNTLQFEDVSNREADLGPDLDRTSALARFHVRDSDGALVSGPPAFVKIWAHAPGFRWLTNLSKIPGMMWVLERVYRLFLVLRPFLSRALGPILKRREARKGLVDQ